ncbi:MAG: glycosyl hydrolase [Actinomycetia bacterium]|nr:glycosyl hydrolase [Actinomycetes bacterium]
MAPERSVVPAGGWTCRPTPAGEVTTPDALDDLDWVPAAVPGTAAGAWREAGRWAVPDDHDFDAEDWWFRTRVTGAAGPQVLRLDGLATLAEVWWRGQLVLRSESMFQPHRVDVEATGDDELAIRFLAFGPVVSARHPRGRWRTRLVEHQHLRWHRTTFLGRMPGWASIAAPVGPWRPVTVEPVVEAPRLGRVWCDGADGVVEVAGATTVEVDGVAVPVVDGVARVADVDRWWPHTHGPPVRHPVVADGHDLGLVGFRTVEADRTGDGFRLVVNGTPIFARGACWVPPDVVTLAADPRPALERARDAGMNLVRITGTTVWEDDRFWDACDELGLLVWQDCMFANVDPPDDEAFLATAEDELTAQLGALRHRAALAVVCGGSEVEQQAAMLGLPADRRAMPLFDTHLPKLLDRLGLDVPYVPSSPTGGDLPFQPGAGIAHYYGVGAYLRPLDDARRAGVRFAAESLAFATPPEREAVDSWFGTAAVAGHHPAWKWAVPRDNGSPWDFEDVRDHYVGALFGVDVAGLRATDAERYLDLGRAAVAHLVEATFTEWRRPGSSCDGGLVLALRDLWPGAGWGVLDAAGRPKAPWWAMRRVLRPLALLATDEGLNGLHLHVVNDTPEPVTGAIEVELFDATGRRLEAGTLPVSVAGRDGTTLSADSAFEGFRDLTYAYRFGPQAYDVVVATLRDDAGAELAHVVHPVGGPARSIVPSIGLGAVLDGDVLVVTTDRFAQHVVVEGGDPDDSWFHLPPGGTRRIALRDPARVEVRALNTTEVVRP